VEAAKLAPRCSHELALVREKELQQGNTNRSTLAVARKMVAYLLAAFRYESTIYQFTRLVLGGHSPLL